MKIKKGWWYVIALIAIIILIMVIFRDEVGLAPSEAKESRDSSVIKDIGFIRGDEKYSRTQVRNADNLIAELRKLSDGYG